MLKSRKAITLIALVITIVVLIILAGVTINLTLGDNGIFNKAKYAKEEYLNSKISENTALDNYKIEIDEYTSNDKLYAEDFEFNPSNSNWNVKNVKEALDYFYNL